MPKSARLGQNFLHDRNIARKIIDVFLPQPGPVLEIGAGPGILSDMLLEKMPQLQLTLVEIDPFLAQRLRERFAGRLTVVESDILAIDLAELFPGRPVALIGNLPYHISKDLIDWFISQRAGIEAAVLMLQKDFVDKLLSPPGVKKYNAQSVVFQLLFRVRRCFPVSPGSFLPQPRIMSTVLAVSPAPAPTAASSPEFYDFVKLSFAERRKTLWNNLASGFSREALNALIDASALPPQTRAEQLPPEKFLALWKSVGDLPGKDG